MQTATEEPCETGSRRHSAGLSWALGKGDLHSRRLAAGESIEITVLDGECWITMEGHSEDHVLDSGSGVRLQGPGLLLMEGLHPYSYGTVGFSHPD